MRYDATISYRGNHLHIKVTNKAYSGTLELPEFIKAVRMAKGHDYNGFGLNTATKPHELEAYENNTEPIPREFLIRCSLGYGLPMKLCNLGVTNTERKESPLALRLRELRLKAGLTQEQIAPQIDVARATYAGYEVGKSVPDIYTLEKIANVYGVSLDYLINRKYT